MEAYFEESVTRLGQGETDVGFVIEGSDRAESVEEMNQLLYDGDAYKVEVFQNDKGICVNVFSGDVREFAELEDKIELNHQGVGTTLIQKTGKPQMPSECRNPDRAIEMYSRYARDHGNASSLKIEDVDWANLLEK